MPPLLRYRCPHRWHIPVFVDLDTLDHLAQDGDEVLVGDIDPQFPRTVEISIERRINSKGGRYLTVSPSAGSVGSVQYPFHATDGPYMEPHLEVFFAGAACSPSCYGAAQSTASPFANRQVRRMTQPPPDTRLQPPSDIELAAIVRNFHTARVLVVGDIILDRYISGAVHRLSPKRRSRCCGRRPTAARWVARRTSH